MRLLIDTNVAVDFLQSRDPFSEAALFLFQIIDVNGIDAFVTSKSITDIYYLVHRTTHNDTKTREIMRDFLEIVYVLDTTQEDVVNALDSKTKDYEDAVMIETAIREEMDIIVTRNKKDFNKSPIRIYNPSECIEYINAC